MPSHAELKAQLMKALGELPKPVSREAVAQCADKILPAWEAKEFQKWFEGSGTMLMRQLNA